MRSRKTAVPLATAAALLGAMTIAPAAVADEAESQDTTHINGWRNVGYYGSWHVAGEESRGVSLKRLFVDGDAGGTITHLNYSFGNVAGSQAHIDAAIERGVQGLDEVDEYTCFISDETEWEDGQSDTAGAADADMTHLFPAADSVLGIADTADQPLAGNLNQLAQLKRLYPDLRVNVSLGGWTWSKNFSPAVATPERRTKLVESCIDLWIHGNLPVIDGFGGEGVAAGIFDGFDLDWEWPGGMADWGPVGHPDNYVDVENDRENFRLFTKELREALDALTLETGKKYEISGFLPAGGVPINGGGWNDPEFFQYLDYGNLQGYDLWGPWGNDGDWGNPDGPRPVTGHQGNIYGESATEYNWGTSLESVVAAYVDNGIPASKLNIGIGSYGYGWLGAEQEPWEIAEAPAWQSDGSASLPWDLLKDRDLDYFGEYVEIDGAQHLSATWAYNAETGEWWTVDTPEMIEAKVEWAIANGLGGIDFWELGYDVNSDFASVSAAALRNSAAGPASGPEVTAQCASATPWNASTEYEYGDFVFIDGSVFYATDENVGQDPALAGAPWKLSSCGAEVPDRPEDDDLPGTGNEPVLSVTGNAVVGGKITINGKHFTPGDDVRIELHSTPVLLGLTTADAEGSFSLEATIPEDLTPGVHTVVALVDGVEVATYELNIVAGLSDTGIGTSSAVAALMLLLAGGGALALNRRRAVS